MSEPGRIIEHDWRASMIRTEHHLWGDMDIWDVTAPALTWREPDGTLIRPDRHHVTDFGTIPPRVAGMHGFARHRPEYIFHDAGYAHEGLWFSDDNGATWAYRQLAREWIDSLLYRLLNADTYWLWQLGRINHTHHLRHAWANRIIYGAVVTIGLASWERWRAAGKDQFRQ